MTLPVVSATVAPSAPRLTLVPDEHDWVARIQRGDQRAFEELYLASYAPLCSFALLMVGGGRRDVAEELVQDVLCWIWERRAEWRPAGNSVRGYLFRAVRNQAINYLKRVERERRAADALPQDMVALGMGRPERAPDDAAALTELDAALTCALEGLSPRCREACVLHWRHGLSYPEVASAMGITVKGAEALVTRGLKCLRGAMVAFGDAPM
jgi:RNA polymerase sigma-70 factor (ECF subfamily)